MKVHNHILVALSATLLFASCENTELTTDNILVAVTENDQPVADCSTAPASWFTEDNNGIRKTPAPNEGATSVFANNATVTNCDFQRWSWQKFLWLTNDVNGTPFFLENMTQVSSIGDTLGKGSTVILTDTSQASGISDILKSNTDAATYQNTVYYSILANDVLLNTLKTYAPMANNPADSNKLEGVTFPVGALEMKTSWLNASALGADSSTYYITDGEINGKPARVALLGIHVVGIVENHPEFIWATFEHDELAPMYDWSEATHTSDANVTSSTGYPLFTANAKATTENITSGAGINTNVFNVYDHGVPVEINAAGQKEYMATSQTNALENLQNIQDLNASVKDQLSDVWRNYFLNGSIWINTEGYEGVEAQAALLDSLSYQLSSSSPGDLTRGSVAAYNITMETYVQFGFGTSNIYSTTVSDLANCFSCHNANYAGKNSPLKISHLFNGYSGRLEGMSKKEVKETHVQVMRANAILRSIHKE